jgi:hypothetical protein
MALFTDAPISTLDQLAAQDTAVLNVASTEGIDATAKLTLAQNELGAELVAATSRSPFAPTSLLTWWPGMILTSSVQLSSIAVTPPLLMWHTFHALELIYRDAYYNQLNDRYQSKWNAYKDLSKWAAGLLFQTGVGVVGDPVPIAQSPEVDVVSGTLPAGNYFVEVTWLNSSGGEGMPSPVSSASATGENSVQVTANNPPSNAVGWNVYAGTSINSMTLQNAVPIDTGQIWVLPPSGLVLGVAPGTGQAPDYFCPLPRYLQRG